MKIRFYSNLRAMIGQSSLDFTDPNLNTLRLVFDRLIGIYPELGPHLFDNGDDLRKDVPIFVNGRNPRLTEAGINILLQADDEISLFTPISSGRMNVEVMRGPTFGKQE